MHYLLGGQLLAGGRGGGFMFNPPQVLRRSFFVEKVSGSSLQVTVTYYILVILVNFCVNL